MGGKNVADGTPQVYSLVSLRSMSNHVPLARVRGMRAARKQEVGVANYCHPHVLVVKVVTLWSGKWTPLVSASLAYWATRLQILFPNMLQTHNEDVCRVCMWFWTLQPLSG